MLYHIENILYTVLAMSIIGYLFSVVKEHLDFLNQKINIKSDKITQRIIDELDMKIFKLGNRKLNIGDEVKIYLHDKKRVKGVLLGASKKENSLVLVTQEDELVELHVKTIRRLKITTKYGRLF